MAWYTPQWRQRLSARRIRFALTRAAAAAAPGLMRKAGFYGRGVAMDRAASAVAFVDDLTADVTLSAAEADYIESRCQRFDGGRAPRYWAPPWGFRREYFHVEAPLFLGHTGRFADPSGHGVLTADGAPENWNRDKPALLRDAAPCEGVALPVRAFSNYFHFLFEAALPIVAYFESGAARPEAHEILAVSRGRRGFAEETLTAIAAGYGARLRWIGPGERVRCRHAIVWRLENPAADWFPARRATAARLGALLTAAADPAPEAVGEAVYLRRANEKRRNLTNAGALDAALAARGFTPFDPTGKRVADQVAALGGARTIVAVHGAGLANLLWAPKGARVVEIISEDSCKSVYLVLAKQLGLEHRAVIGPAGDAKQNFAAPVDAVLAALDAA